MAHYIYSDLNGSFKDAFNLFNPIQATPWREGEVRLHGLDLADERIDEVLDAHDQLIAALPGEVHDARGALRHLRCMAGFVRVR